MIRSRSSRISSGADRLAGAALALAAALCALPSDAASRPSRSLLIARPFPVEAHASFPGGLFHWIDSLAGTTAGKTVDAHRDEYLKLFGPVTASDRTHIAAFVAARAEHFRKRREAPPEAIPRATGSALLRVFCAAASVEAALAAARPALTPETWNGLAAAMAYFKPKYEVVWNHAAVPNAFLDAVRHDPRLPELEALLAKIVRFYGVDPSSSPPPRIALVPVPAGYGTHAEAIDGILLLEIRPRDTLADEASVIVHELSHYLWGIVPPERQARLAAYAASLDEASVRTFRLLGEAVPTALGQGVADRAFNPGTWAPEEAWYHQLEIDACARRIYPVVASALEAGLTYNEVFLLKVFQQDRPRPSPSVGRPRFLVSAGDGPYIAPRTGTAGVVELRGDEP